MVYKYIQLSVDVSRDKAHSRKAHLAAIISRSIEKSAHAISFVRRAHTRVYMQISTRPAVQKRGPLCNLPAAYLYMSAGPRAISKNRRNYLHCTVPIHVYIGTHRWTYTAAAIACAKSRGPRLFRQSHGGGSAVAWRKAERFD